MLIRNLKRQLNTIGLLLICFLMTTQAMAQTFLLRGNVKDANGLPMAGASVVLEGTKRGTITDASGSYELKVSPGTYNLVISYVGVQTQRKQVTVTAGAVIESSFDMQNAGDLNRIII